MIAQELLKPAVENWEVARAIVKLLLDHKTFGSFLKAAQSIEFNDDRTEIRVFFPPIIPGQGVFTEITEVKQLDIIRARIYQYILTTGYDVSVVIRS